MISMKPVYFQRRFKISSMGFRHSTILALRSFRRNTSLHHNYVEMLNLETQATLVLTFERVVGFDNALTRLLPVAVTRYDQTTAARAKTDMHLAQGG